MQRVPWPFRWEYVYKPLGMRFFPKQEQFLRTVENAIQFLTLVGGINGAKSYSSAYYILPEVVMVEALRELNGWQGKKVNVWIVGDNYEQPRKEFAYITEAIDKSAALTAFTGGWREKPSQPREGSWFAETNSGVVLQTKSWTNPESLHSEEVHIMLAVEAGLLDFWTYENRLLPRIGKVNGIFVANGTFEESGIFLKDLYKRGLGGSPRHKSFSIASWENTFAYPGGYDDPAIVMMREEMTHETFMERCGAVPKKPSGLVHPYFDYAHHMSEQDFDSSLPVRIAVDPGANGYYVGAYQVRGAGTGRKAWQIDEYFESTNGTTAKAIQWLTAQPWANNVRGGAIDVRQPEQREIWYGGREWYANNPSRLRGVVLNARHVPVGAGIERVNTLLHSHAFDAEKDAADIVDFDGDKGVPRLFFNHRCKRITWELSQGYRYPRPQGGQQMRQVPKDENNHGAKALAYLMVDEFGFVEALRRNPERDREPLAHLRAPKRKGSDEPRAVAV